MSNVTVANDHGVRSERSSIPRFDRDRTLSLGVAGTVVAAVVFRVYRLSAQSLWNDEAMTLEMSDTTSFIEHVAEIFGLSTGGERFQPLYNLLMPYWRLAFGESEAGLRSFSVVASVAAAVLVILTARRVFGPVHAIWTGMLAACSAYAVFYAQEARPYALLMMLTSAQVFCLSPVLAGEDLRTTSPWWRRAHAAVVLVGSFGSVFFVIFAGALGAAHLLIDRKLGRWLSWWWPAALAGIPAVLFYFGNELAWDPANRISVARHGFPVVESLAFVVYGVLVGLTYGPSMLSLHSEERWSVVQNHSVELAIFAAVTIGIAIALTMTLASRDTDSTQRRAGGFLVTAAVIGLGLSLILAIVTQVTWLPRHSFFLWVPLVLVLPLIAVPARTRPLGVTLVVLYLLLNAYSLNKHYHRYEYSKEDYRGVAEYLMAPGNAQLPSVMVYGWARLLRHYGDDRTQSLNRSHADRLASAVSDVTDAAPEVLVILAHEHYWKNSVGADLPTLIEEGYAIQDIEVFQNIKVYRVTRKADNPSAESESAE